MGFITVSNLGKAYKQYPTRWSRLVEWLDPFGKQRHHLRWVLKDIDFTVQPGEAVGLIGINGAGKSTLLKIITGTTRPTVGTVQIGGRVAALLELGMGFHPDFTGRQNVFMAGQLLGHTIDDVAILMPKIEAFAEINEYIDQPVRVYSSGMQMRLAFSVATAYRPDVLIVDEALSVGDAYFQHKSFDRIREFRKQGTTLLIVSHDKQAIQSICDRAILLDAGSVAMMGTPEAVLDYYNARLHDRHNQTIQQVVIDENRIQTTSGTGDASVTAISLVDVHGKLLEVVDVGQSVRLCVEVTAKADILRLVMGYGIKDRLGQVVYGTNTDLKDQPLFNVAKGERFLFDIAFTINLGPGSYSIQTALVSSGFQLSDTYEWCDLLLTFTVVNLKKSSFAGFVWLDPEIKISKSSG